MKQDRLVKLATYPTVFEAECAKAALDSAGIPAMLQSHGATAVLGAGFQGAVVGGAVLFVRSEDLDRAWTCVVDRGV
ncbi:MAG TPA: DUF2007 domain-containing protein [Gemmatimonadaceae bacterium]|nr:DUF2007 domain-containing protein [Gemmatimonadaceae bacterium]